MTADFSLLLWPAGQAIATGSLTATTSTTIAIPQELHIRSAGARDSEDSGTVTLTARTRAYAASS